VFDPVALATGQCLKFTLVAFRMMGIVMFAPMLGSKTIPVKIRVLLGLGLSWVVFPAAQTAMEHWPTHLIGYVIAVAGEFAIGATMGLLALLVFVGVQLGGQIVGQQMGLALARVYNPQLNDSVPMMAQLYYWLALTVFICVGGHIRLVGSMIHSFQTVPLLGLAADPAAFDLLMDLMREVFVIGIRIAAPALVALTLTSVTLGFIARTVPQMNILVVGFPIRVALGFMMVSASLMGCAYYFQDIAIMAQDAVDSMIAIFGGKGTAAA